MDKRVVLVTGSNKGLGKEIARQLGVGGFIVILASRDLSSGESVKREFFDSGISDVHVVKFDVTSSVDIASAVSFVEQNFGKLDVLVNNAGVALEWDGGPTGVDKIRKTLDVNLVAPFAVTDAFVPLLSKSSDARVINQSSMLGSIGTAEANWGQVSGFMSVGYSASKAGLNMLTLVQSKTLGDKGILVAASHPGWVKTDLGTGAAPMGVVEGASTVVELVTISRDSFPNGQLVHKGERLPW